MIRHFLSTICLGLSLLLFATPVLAADQTKLGTGNQAAVNLSQKSPLVQSAKQLLLQQIQQVQNRALKITTQDAIANSKTCVTHRAEIGDNQKAVILQKLTTAGLVNTADDATFPGGLKAGVFPPLQQDGSRCPQLPQTFYSAPGGVFGSHHSYPGGLAIHEAFNEISDLNFSNSYRRVYGFTQADGLPKVNLSNSPKLSANINISEDVIITAPIWHDWAKSIVFQWNSDGTEFEELNFGGNGKTDNYGNSGDSKTASHHIIGLAEVMKRRLPADVVITQASAHSSPTLGNEYKVVNWLNAAAIIAQLDPVAAGYLYRDQQNKLRLPPLRQLGNFNLNAAGQINLLAEYALHNLSDADYNLTVPAVTISQVLLQAIAPKFGYNLTDTATYNNRFRNPVLSYLSAERLLIIYGNSGMNGVSNEINKLRQRQLI